MALQVAGKTALVTGGGSGICLEFVKLLLENKCNVVVADLALTPAADEALRPYQSAAGDAKKTPGVVYVNCDVTDWKQLRAAFDEAVDAFGRLDVVCPGAGLFEPTWANFWRPDQGTDTDASSSFKTIDVNVSHPIRATQLAIDYFLRQPAKRGAVVLISSIAAQMPFFPVPVYVASKHAVSGFTRAMATLEPQLGIRVNAVAPGIVKTPLWSDTQKNWVDDSVDKWCTTREVAEAMLDLVQKEENVGGTVVEISVGGRRNVEGLNDPGPGSEGHSVGKAAEAYGQTLEIIQENFGKQRKSGGVAGVV